MTLPEPLTPPDCDLTDFSFMPLDVRRLRDSDLAAEETPETCWAAMLLWCAAWHQVPAGSLPDNDRVLSNLAGYGRVVTEWEKARAGALRGFIKCSDGRLYHPVVAEKANDAWRAKLAQRWKTELARIKKHCQRHGLSFDPPSFDEWLSQGCPQGQPLSVPGTTSQSSWDNESTRKGQDTDVPRETPSKGQGEGQGYIKDKPLSGEPDPVGTETDGPARDQDARTEQARQIIDHLNAKTGHAYQQVEANLKSVRARLGEGASAEQVKAVIDAKARGWGNDPKMADYLRPKTLFSATNFAQYLGQLGSSGAAGKQLDANWWEGSGFEDKWDAINAGCTEHSAWMFEGGKKVRTEQDWWDYKTAREDRAEGAAA